MGRKKVLYYKLSFQITQFYREIIDLIPIRDSDETFILQPRL